MSRSLNGIGRWLGLECYRGEIETCRGEIKRCLEDAPDASGRVILFAMRINESDVLKRQWLTRLKDLLTPCFTPAALIEHFDDPRKYDIPAVKMPPTLFRRLRYLDSYESSPAVRLRGALPKEAGDLLAAHGPLRMVAENLMARHPREGAKSPHFGEMEAFLFFEYARNVLQRYRPAAIVLWNAFSPFSAVLRYTAELHNLPCLFMEYGSIPGTLSIETMGQMGESFPARNPEDFNRLPIHSLEVDAAGEHLARLRKSGLNRRRQPTVSCRNVIEEMRADNGGPVIFYAGQNDFESGMVPESENSRRYHSPIFKSTAESLVHLDALAEKNGWNLVFKPHPIVSEVTADFAAVPLKRTRVLPDANINEAIDLTDITATILSQTGYIALMRNKPLLSLGFNQLRGSGAAYEAFTADSIEGVLSSALRYGFTREHRNAFSRHVARMFKYYLYDDLSERVRVCRKNEYDCVTILDKLAGGRRVVY